MNERVVVGIVTPVLESHGLELDSIDIIPAGKRKVLRLSVDGDGPLGRGPLLDDIAAATRDISQALDDSDQIGDAPYTLEVSSRGIGKPLVEPRHFRRNTGRLVLANLLDGSQLRGRITGCDQAGVTITEEPEPGKRLPQGVDPVHQVPYDELTRATVQVEMNRKPDPDLDDVGEPGDDDADDDFETDEEN